MGILTRILGWSWKVRRLRKKWDRLREKALKKEGEQRKELLSKLDSLENNLRALEEQPLGRISRSRVAKQIEIELAEIKAMLKAKPEEFSEYMKAKELRLKK